MVQEAPGFSQISRLSFEDSNTRRICIQPANTSFVTFFMLNARALLSARIKFFNKKLLTAASIEEHKKKFQVDLRASDRARLLFTIACHHVPVEFLAEDLDFMDLTDPFDCDCPKLWLS